MTARELFGVIVRTIGLVISLVGILVLIRAVGFVINMAEASASTRTAFKLDGDPVSNFMFVSGSSMLALGMLFLFGADRVVRVVYGRKKPNSSD